MILQYFIDVFFNKTVYYSYKDSFMMLKLLIFNIINTRWRNQTCQYFTPTPSLLLIVSIYCGIAGMPVLIRRLKDNPSARSVSEKPGCVFNV